MQRLRWLPSVHTWSGKVFLLLIAVVLRYAFIVGSAASAKSVVVRLSADIDAIDQCVKTAVALRSVSMVDSAADA